MSLFPKLKILEYLFSFSSKEVEEASDRLDPSSLIFSALLISLSFFDFLNITNFYCGVLVDDMRNLERQIAVQDLNERCSMYKSKSAIFPVVTVLILTLMHFN